MSGDFFRTNVCPLCQRELAPPHDLELKVITTLHEETGQNIVYTVLVRSQERPVGELMLLNQEQLDELRNPEEQTSLETP